MSNFLKNVIKETGNEYGTIVSDGLATADVSGYVDTGSYVFNALCSGSLYGGLPQNKITAIAGESATGKDVLCSWSRSGLPRSEPGSECSIF